MRIEIDKLDETGESFAHSFAPNEVFLDDDRTRATKEIKIEGQARRKGERVRLNGRLQAELEIACDRCLRGIPLAINDEFDVVYAPADEKTEAERIELQTDDLEWSVYEGDFINTNEVAREQLLLNLPTRALCKEDCKGLCPSCGADLNSEGCGCEQKTVDPRWEALKNLNRK